MQDGMRLPVLCALSHCRLLDAIPVLGTDSPGERGYDLKSVCCEGLISQFLTGGEDSINHQLGGQKDG